MEVWRPYSHPPDRTSTEHPVIVSHPPSPPLVRGPTTDLHTLHPAVEAADDVARIRRLFEIGALALEDLVFDGCHLLV